MLLSAWRTGEDASFETGSLSTAVVRAVWKRGNWDAAMSDYFGFVCQRLLARWSVRIMCLRMGASELKGLSMPCSEAADGSAVNLMMSPFFLSSSSESSLSSSGLRSHSQSRSTYLKPHHGRTESGLLHPLTPTPLPPSDCCRPSASQFRGQYCAPCPSPSQRTPVSHCRGSSCHRGTR